MPLYFLPFLTQTQLDIYQSDPSVSPGLGLTRCKSFPKVSKNDPEEPRQDSQHVLIDQTPNTSSHQFHFLIGERKQFEHE
jgi:hypothetical protein